MTKPFRIGVGSGFAGDRFEPAQLLAKNADLDSLVFECLAERTIAAAQGRKANSSGPGFDPLIVKRIMQVAPFLLPHGKSIVTNAGASDPLGGAKAIKSALEQSGMNGYKVSAVIGDDVLADLDFSKCQIIDSSDTLEKYQDQIISANAYLGSEPIVQALDDEADIVITGRNSDASLFLAPLIQHFGWQNPNQIAAGILVGHLLECAGQLTGGYFADLSKKLVPNLANLGFPFADVNSDGSAIFSKLPNSGGLLNRQTVLEQLLYEIENPGCYITPDINIDLRCVQIAELGENQVKVSGAIPLQKPEKLKVSVGIRDGFAATGQILYSGSESLERAYLAGEILSERWQSVHRRDANEISLSYIGHNAARPWDVKATAAPSEVALFVALQSNELDIAELLCQEVESLYTNGPYGGGGVNTTLKPTIGLVSTLIDRSLVQPKVVTV